MRKTTILAVVTAAVCILISGCGAGITISGDGFAVGNAGSDRGTGGGIIPGTEEAKPDFTEENDELEKPEKPLNEIDGLESIGIKEIEDNWPENIRYHADGLYADPMTVTFQIDAPVTVSLACKTRDGKLRLKLIGPENSENKICFDETDPDGTYTVKLDRPGEYQALFYAEHHMGSVEIVPVEE